MEERGPASPHRRGGSDSRAWGTTRPRVRPPVGLRSRRRRARRLRPASAQPGTAAGAPLLGQPVARADLQRQAPPALRVASTWAASSSLAASAQRSGGVELADGRSATSQRPQRGEDPLDGILGVPAKCTRHTGRRLIRSTTRRTICRPKPAFKRADLHGEEEQKVKEVRRARRARERATQPTRGWRPQGRRPSRAAEARDEFIPSPPGYFALQRFIVPESMSSANWK